MYMHTQLHVNYMCMYACVYTLYAIIYRPILYIIQAYTSQYTALVMFGLMMSEDRVSIQPRRREIIDGLGKMPGETHSHTHTLSLSVTHTHASV